MAISLDALDTRSDNPIDVPFHFFLPDGSEVVVTFQVLSAHSATVTAALNALGNERRRKEAAAAASAMGGRNNPPVTTVEEDIAYGQKAIAARLVGWRGIKDEFSPAAALRLVQSNPEAADVILRASSDLTRFTTVSPKA
jgi:hypothetical protein